MTVEVQDRILTQCHTVLNKAAALFPHLDFRGVDVKFNLKGSSAGQARRDWGEYSLRFNRDYAEHDPNIVLNDIVPHEIAHLACFMDVTLGKGHCAGWKKICLTLGGSGSTTHTVPKIFCKGNTYEYITTTGCAVRVSEHMHIKIQAGAAYRYSKREGDVHRKCQFKIV